MKKGYCIAFEGIDGSGKTTQSELLSKFLRSKGHEVITEHEPTKGQWGRKLRESGSSGRLSSEQELEYFLNDRKEHVEEIIAPSLAKGIHVVLDRYYFSNMAYQGCRGIDPQEIRKKNEAFAPKPDLLIILDLEVDEGLARIKARGDIANEFEKRDDLERCRKIFLSLRNEDFVKIISSGMTMEEVAQQIQDTVHHRLDLE